MISVIQRDGSTRPLDIQKIRDVINWACQNLPVNSIILESRMNERLRDKITSDSIQKNLIHNALELCTPDDPVWRYVAGRLHIWELRKSVFIGRGFGYSCQSWICWLYQQIEIGKYDDRLLSYTREELQSAYLWINPEWDLDYDYAGASLLSSRYCLPNELPQETFLLCALLLAIPENLEDRMDTARAIYVAIASRQISLATPILGNLRSPNSSLSSCFIMSVADNLESIFTAITNTARISKNGGGVGVILSQIRATGSWVMGKSNVSGGIIPWVKLLNDTAIAVNQGGRRAGAVTVGLDIWHLDVPEFLEMQAENGDQRRKAYDVFPQLIISDEFMRRVESDAEWILLDPHEVAIKLKYNLAELWGEAFEVAYSDIESQIERGIISLYKRIRAKDLFKSIMRSQLETGMPYLAFKDTINRVNPNQHLGYIPGVNLCNESFSNVSTEETIHCCNLISVNLANISDTNLESVCRLAVRTLDNTIEITNPPIPEARRHNEKYRTIGVGMMGLADWLAYREIKYDMAAASPDVRILFEKFAFYCTDESANLAITRGAYPAFKGSLWSQGILPIDCTDEPTCDWQNLIDKIKATGIRNSHITAVAPNTSSSLIQGCTASVLPVFSRFFINKGGKNSVPIAPVFSNKFWWYSENKNLDQQAVVNLTGLLQKYIDTGISMELMFNLNTGIYYPDEPNRSISAKEIYSILLSAWKQKIKAIYYVRSVQRDNFQESCSGCAN